MSAPNLVTIRGLLQGAQVRVAKFQNRDHVVVPLVALIGDVVIHPANAPAPEFVPSSVLAAAPGGWNGRPVVMGHPDNGHIYISANDPTTLEKCCFGHLFNTRYTRKRLLTEAWLDPARAKDVGEDAERVIERVQAGEVVEVSVGTYTSLDDEPGEINGATFHASWTDIVPDHLAMLGDREEGACSVEMGCGGPRVNTAPCAVPERPPNRVIEVGMLATSEFHIQTLIFPKSHWDSSKKCKAWARRHGYTTAKVDEKSSSYRLRQRDPDDFTRLRTICINPGRGASIDSCKVKAVGGPLKSGVSASQANTLEVSMADTKPRGLWQKILAAAARLTFNEEGVSDSDIRWSLHRAIRAVEPGFECVVEVFQDPNIVIYSTCPEREYLYWRRTFAVTANSAVAIADDREQVRPVMRYEPVVADGEGEEGDSDTTYTTAAAPRSSERTNGQCSCQSTSVHAAPTPTQEASMATNKSEVVGRLIANKAAPFTDNDRAHLEALSEEDLSVLDRVFPVTMPAATATAAQPADATPTPTTPAVAVVAKPKTLAEWMAEAPPELRDLVTRHQVAETTHRAQLVGLLKQTQTAFAETELVAMGTDGLEKLCTALGVQFGAPVVRDFSVQAGVAPDSSSTGDAPDPWDLKGAASRTTTTGQAS